MSQEQLKNRPASIRAKLHNIARKENIDLNVLIVLYMQERILYRLSQSPVYERLLKEDDFVKKWQYKVNAWT